MPHRWRRIIDGSDRSRITEKIKHISQALESESSLPEKIGLLNGKTGVALFFFYYAEVTGIDRYYDRALEIISGVFDEINKGFDLHTFCMGIGGVGWALEHLARQGFIKTDTDEMLEEVDPFIYQVMMGDIRNGHYDYLHGAIGGGLYFLSRLPRGKSKRYLEDLLDEMENTGIEESDGSVKWQSIVDFENDRQGVNLGMAHGSASIIAFLSRLYEAGIRIDKTGRLLSGAVRHVLKHQQDIEPQQSLFPRYVSDGEPPVHSRLAWCYGDLGIGMALWQAAEIAGRREWKQRAVDILKHSCLRREPALSGVKDACICHGTAGIAHIYNRIYHYTRLRDFKSASLYWIEETMKMARFSDGYGGFKMWHGKETGGWAAAGDLLTGVAGIGLALLSTVFDMEPVWDRCLLLS